jgi:hypothetical protein
MKRKFAIVLLLLVLFATAAIVTVRVISWNEVPSADCTAVEFHEQYKNWKEANRRYAGRSLTIRGKVLSVEYHWTTPNGWKSVGLGQEGAGVICDFPPATVDQAERLAPGQMAILRGICKGEFDGWPILSECVVEWAND